MPDACREDGQPDPTLSLLMSMETQKYNTGITNVQDTVEEKEWVEILPQAVENITKVAAFEPSLACQWGSFPGGQEKPGKQGFQMLTWDSGEHGSTEQDTVSKQLCKVAKWHGGMLEKPPECLESFVSALTAALTPSTSPCDFPPRPNPGHLLRRHSLTFLSKRGFYHPLSTAAAYFLQLRLRNVSGRCLFMHWLPSLLQIIGSLKVKPRLGCVHIWGAWSTCDALSKCFWMNGCRTVVTPNWRFMPSDRSTPPRERWLFEAFQTSKGGRLGSTSFTFWALKVSHESVPNLTFPGGRAWGQHVSSRFRLSHVISMLF